MVYEPSDGSVERTESAKDNDTDTKDYFDSSTDIPTVKASQVPEVSWTASEYIAHEKGLSWFISLYAGVIAIVIVIYFATHNYFSAAMVGIMGIIFGIFSARKPESLTYTLNSGGLQIGEKQFDYNQFKYFSIMDEGAIYSIRLEPLRRFAPPISIYYAPEDEDKIVNIFSDYLPIEERKHDLTDTFMRKIRF